MIQHVGEAFKVRQQVIATAIVYFRRYYARNSLGSIDPLLLGPSALFLASKVEEFGALNPNKLVNYTHNIGFPTPRPPLVYPNLDENVKPSPPTLHSGRFVDSTFAYKVAEKYLFLVFWPFCGLRLPLPSAGTSDVRLRESGWGKARDLSVTLCKFSSFRPGKVWQFAVKSKQIVVLGGGVGLPGQTKKHLEFPYTNKHIQGSRVPPPRTNGQSCVLYRFKSTDL